jgi:hypothetical protein
MRICSQGAHQIVPREYLGTTCLFPAVVGDRSQRGERSGAYSELRVAPRAVLVKASIEVAIKQLVKD